MSETSVDSTCPGPGYLRKQVHNQRAKCPTPLSSDFDILLFINNLQLKLNADPLMMTGLDALVPYATGSYIFSTIIRAMPNRRGPVLNCFIRPAIGSNPQSAPA